MDTTTVPATQVVAGDFIHRVERRAPSRVFEAPVNRRVKSVERQVYSGVSYVVLHLEDDGISRNAVLNLDPDRQVDVRRQS